MRTYSTRTKVLIAVIALVLCAGVTTGCRNAKVGARCRTTELGQNRTHVLQCKKGRWVRIMTRQRAIDILVAIARSRATTTTTPTTATTPTPPGPKVVQVAIGDGFSCGRFDTGIVKCWGKGDVGQLGAGSPTGSLTPVAVTGVSGATALTIGQSHACAVVAAGAVRCWGLNTNGQLGDGTTTDRSTPVAVTGVSGAIAVAAGTSHTCAVLSGGTVKCWGDNTAGQLGNGTTTASTAPVDATGVTTAASIAAANTQTCIVTTGGGAFCWGNNGTGQLGDGTTTNRTTAVAVSGLAAGIALIDAGATFTCARNVAGTAKCWGNNFFGMLGDGTPLPNGTNSSTPVDVGGVTAATWVSAGTDHACAVDGGTAKCWGLALSNRLGNGGATDTSTPVVVTGITNATQIDAGFGHSCVLRNDSSVACFGINVNGELGNGTTLATGGAGPVAVIGL